MGSIRHVMIDIHCHILPGVDDGPETINEAVEMCRIARADGIETIVATPHAKFDRSPPSDIMGPLTTLQSEISRQGIGLSILLGADVSVSPELHSFLMENPSLFVNGTGRYFLAELPHDIMPARWEQFLLSFRRSGITPIVTHPERNRWFLTHPDALYPFVLGGGLVQVTAMSVTGENGDMLQRYCRSLLERNLVHVIASDGHSSTLRKPVLSAAVSAASTIIGKAAARRLVEENPRAIIDGRAVDAPEPVMMMPRKRSWFRRVLDL